MQLPKPIADFWKTVRETGSRFMQLDPLTEAGSLAFTTVFAIPGVFIIALTVASFFYDPGEVSRALYTQAGGLLGGETIKDVDAMVQKASKSETGLFARITGIIALVFSATTAFAALQSSLNKIWRVEAKPGRALWRYVLSRLVSLGMIAAFGFLLLVSLVIDSTLVAMGERFGGAMADRTVWATIAGFVGSFAVVTLVFASVYKFLPDIRVPWRFVWVGSLFTAALFSIGKYLIGLYIAKSGAGDAFGAGGAVVIVMLWVYYSSVILLFGAQYTQVSALKAHAPLEATRQARLVPV